MGGRPNLRKAYRAWADAAPGREAALAFGRLEESAIECGFVRERQFDAERILLWVQKVTGLPLPR